MSRKAKPSDNDSVIWEGSTRYNLRQSTRSTSSTVERHVFVSGQYIHHGDHGGNPANFGFVIAGSIDEDVLSPMLTGYNNPGCKGTTAFNGAKNSGKGEACINANNAVDDNDDNDVDYDVPAASVFS